MSYHYQTIRIFVIRPANEITIGLSDIGFETGTFRQPFIGKKSFPPLEVTSLLSYLIMINYLIFFVTTATRTQLRLASVLHHGLFSEECVMPSGTGKRVDIADGLGFTAPGDLLYDAVFVNNTEYKIGMLVVLHVTSQDGVIVGWIKKVIIRNKSVFFCLKTSKCVRKELRYFESLGKSTGNILFKPYSDLKSYKPLIPRGTEESFVFFLNGKLVDDEV